MEAWILGLVVAVIGFCSIFGGGLGGWIYEKLQHRGHENRLKDLEGITQRHTDQINSSRGVEVKAQRKEAENAKEARYGELVKDLTGLFMQAQQKGPDGKQQSLDYAQIGMALAAKYPDLIAENVLSAIKGGKK
jgi:hypothetical protein